MNENKTFFFGEYVLSGLPNAFNQKTSYWLTKKGMTVAMYCFTVMNDLDYQLERISAYIKLFQEKYETQTIQVFVKEPYVRDAQIYLGNDMDEEGFWCMDSENEQYWKDVEASMLLQTFTGVSLEEAKKLMEEKYPDANPQIFEFVSFSGGIV